MREHLCVNEWRPYIVATSLQVLEGDTIFDLRFASVKYFVTFPNLQAGDKHMAYID